MSENAHFELRKVAPADWEIHDLRYGSDHARRVVARVYEHIDTGVEVEWLRDAPLITWYMTPLDVLHDLERLNSKAFATKPVPIPHLPPRLKRT